MLQHVQQEVWQLFADAGLLALCLHLVQMTGKDEIEINIDKIAPQTFHLLSDLIRRKIPDKKAKKKKPPGELEGPVKKK